MNQIKSYASDSAPQEETHLQAIDRNILNTTERASELCARLQRLRERAIGAEAEKGNPASPRPVPCGAIGQIRQHQDDMASVVEAMHSIVSTLESVI